jgi:hypothetical protein
MKLLFSFYRALMNQLTLIAYRFGIMNLERSLSTLFRWKQPVAPYRALIKKQEVALWIELLQRMLDDSIYMLSIFSQIQRIMPSRPVSITLPGKETRL